MREVEASHWEKVADELHAKHGGIPQVMFLSTEPGNTDTTDTEPAPPEDVPSFVIPPAPLTPPLGSLGVTFTRRAPAKGLSFTGSGPLEVEAGTKDLLGEARSTIDKEAAEAVGFAVAPPLYDRGTRVIDLGVKNATKSRAEWEAMPTVHENCANLIAQIMREERDDSVALVRGVMMLDDGSLLVRHVDDAPGDRPAQYVITEQAFAALVTRMSIPAGGRYLRACWPELRAHNVNAWIDRLRATEAMSEAAAAVAQRTVEYVPLDVRLRHRLRQREVIGGDPSIREAFAAVGPGYADLDADKIAEAIAMAVPPGARGRVTYDGRRTRFEILFQTTVQPRHFVAGEFFRAGVVVGTDDTGSGAIAGHAVMHMNMCLNMIYVDVSRTAEFSVRHVGEVSAIAKKFREGFDRAMGSIDHFVKAWDYAVEDNVTERVRAVAVADGRSLPAKEEEVMAGIFRDAIERELVPIRAKTEDAVRSLMRAWGEDRSGAAGTTRAAVANAFTRYAHTSGASDPWDEDILQRAAGGLLRRTANGNGWARSLGFLAPEDVK